MSKTNSMTIDEALAAWREARSIRDRVALDSRYGMAARESSERAAREAEIAYDIARGAASK